VGREVRNRDPTECTKFPPLAQGFLFALTCIVFRRQDDPRGLHFYARVVRAGAREKRSAAIRERADDIVSCEVV